MLDLETLSTKPNAAIAAIGAVAFDDRVSESLAHRFYCVVSPESSITTGFHVAGSTFAWWMQQSDEARAMFKEKGMSLQDALFYFTNWCNSVGVNEMWGNGSDFDCVILGNAYDTLAIPRPWKYSQNRCFRTLKSRVPSTVLNDLWEKHSVGLVHHNALDDAVRQAKIACDLFAMGK